MKKLVLITGSSKGLGLVVAQCLAQNDFNIILTGRCSRQLNSAKFTLNNSEIHTAFSGDLTNKDVIFNFFQEVKIPDVIIHCLGGKIDGDAQPVNADILSKSLELNLGVASNINSYYLPLMQQRKKGRIIHISSDAAETGNSSPAYAAAKAAINAYVKSTARYYAKDNIMICSVLPGVFLHDNSDWSLKKINEPEKYEKKIAQMPLKRFLSVDEISEQIALIANSSSMAYSGELIKLSGGY